MKKVVAIIFVILMFTCFILPVVAESPAAINTYEQGLLDTINAGITVSGSTYYLPASYVITAENYFRTVDLTASQATAIGNSITLSKGLIVNSGVYNGSDEILDLARLPGSTRINLLQLADYAASVVYLEVSYTGKNTNMLITDAQNNIIFNDKVERVLSKNPIAPPTAAPVTEAPAPYTEQPVVTTLAPATSTPAPTATPAASKSPTPAPTVAPTVSAPPTEPPSGTILGMPPLVAGIVGIGALGLVITAIAVPISIHNRKNG